MGAIVVVVGAVVVVVVVGAVVVVVVGAVVVGAGVPSPSPQASRTSGAKSITSSINHRRIVHTSWPGR
jgi:uncharacterized membrane protein